MSEYQYYEFQAIDRGLTDKEMKELRIPSALLDLEAVQSYCDGDRFSARQSDDKLILDFLSENEDGGEWEEDLRLAPFLSLRMDLMRGDLRCLYLGWLSGLQNDEYDEEAFEPLVPPGLQNLNSTLVQLADFLRIDFDLINAKGYKRQKRLLF